GTEPEATQPRTSLLCFLASRERNHPVGITVLLEAGQKAEQRGAWLRRFRLRSRAPQVAEALLGAGPSGRLVVASQPPRHRLGIRQSSGVHMIARSQRFP